MLNRRRFVLAMATCIAGARGWRSAQAQSSYPERYIKVIIPNPAGGPGDIIARTFADKAGQLIGKPFVLEYHPGATTTIGTQLVARAEPDGYTILGFPSSGLAVTVLRHDLRYNLEKDLKPIIGIGSIPLVLIVRSDAKVKSFGGLADAIKKGDITYSSGGVGTIAHLTAARLIADLKGSGTHVTYRGNPQAIQAVLSGQVDFFFASVGEAVQMVHAGKIHALGVTSDQRIAEMPDVPTMIERGLTDFTPKLWFGFLAPSHTPDDRIKRLYDAFAEAGRDPVVQSRLHALGFAVELRDPDALSKMMKEEANKWRSVIAYNKITVGN